MTKLTELLDWFENKNSVLVALSGGVDSALVAYAAFQKLGNSATAVTADYKTLSAEELHTSKQICHEIGIKQFFLHSFDIENFLSSERTSVQPSRSGMPLRAAIPPKRGGLAMTGSTT